MTRNSGSLEAKHKELCVWEGDALETFAQYCKLFSLVVNCDI